MDTTRGYDEKIVVVGGGPAGLAAASAAREPAAVPLLLEAGPRLDARDQFQARTAVEGIGGAGLFSDGKFSFRPSASKLWELDPALLAAAWRETSDLLRRCDIQTDEETDEHGADATGPPATGVGYTFKRYRSVYGTPQQRRMIVAALQNHAPRQEVDVAVTGLQRHGTGWEITTDTGVVTTQRAVFATGRFGPTLLAESRAVGHAGGVVMVPRRLEVGIRVQQAASEFFLRDAPGLDPKLVWRSLDGGLEWRTFCCCRDGLTQPTLTRGLLTVSGRADCPPTGLSNVGFNLRVSDPAVIDREWPGLNNRLQSLRSMVSVGLAEFLDGGGEELRHILGGQLSGGLAEGLRRLRDAFPTENIGTAVLIGPTLEGVGRYPSHDQRLRAAEGLWVAGDMTGSFRGLTAALVSGHVAGSAARRTGRGSSR